MYTMHRVVVKRIPDKQAWKISEVEARGGKGGGTQVKPIQDVERVARCGDVGEREKHPSTAFPNLSRTKARQV